MPRHARLPLSLKIRPASVASDMTNPTPFNDLGRKLLAELPHYTGSESFTRHSLRRSLLMTEGVTYLAETAGAYWLTDIVASYQHTPACKAQPFQVWTLLVRGNAKHSPAIHYGPNETRLPKQFDAVVIMTDGNDDTKPIITQRIPFTDFPLSSVTLWLENNVLMLPGER